MEANANKTTRTKPYQIEARGFDTFELAETWAEQESYRTGRPVHIWNTRKRTVTEVNVRYRRREVAQKYGFEYVAQVVRT